MAALDHLGEQLRRKGVRQAMFDYGTETDEMNEDGFAVAAVAAVARVLRHVGIDHQPVGRPIAEPLRFIGLYLAEGVQQPGELVRRRVLVLEVGPLGAAARGTPVFRPSQGGPSGLAD
ncbi:MAG: hypothetical protein JO287_23940 [Pseudonocardiales bacterium]|nr:hypothetical protein [Pseudonocardiales bacterium]